MGSEQKIGTEKFGWGQRIDDRENQLTIEAKTKWRAKQIIE